MMMIIITVAFLGRPNQVSKEATREKDSAAEAKLLYELLIPRPFFASERAQIYLFGSNTLKYISISPTLAKPMRT